MTVMVVDDSTEMRGLIRDLVAPLADEVVECGDGAECVERFGALRPDWTVMDVQMPRLDGLSAARVLHERFPGAKVLLVTQFPNGGLEAAALKAGAVGCLAKEDLHRVSELLCGPAVEGAMPEIPVASPKPSADSLQKN